MAENTEFPLPPANFTFLVESILMQAQVQLGLLRFGGEEEGAQEPNLRLASHSIDLLAVLQDKTRGNLTVEEQRLLENGLTELRFRYVQVSDDQKKRAAGVGSSTSGTTEESPRSITADGGKGSKSS
jgi:hypothetical protein